MSEDNWMEEKSPARREACARCARPPRVCYCKWLPDDLLAATMTHVLVLQHEHEKRRRAAISSVPVLMQTLENVTLVTVRDDCDCGPGVNKELDVVLYDGGGDDKFDAAMILFPDKHAQPLGMTRGTSESSGGTKRVLLLVIDGTWKEAKKIARRNKDHWRQAAGDWEARGASLQYICLDSEESGDAAIPKQSIYGDLRREPMEGCMSTLEAVASALIVLEPDETRRTIHDSLLRAFEGMVSIQKQFQQRGQLVKLTQYGGTSKAKAIETKRQELQRQQLPKKIDITTAATNSSTPVQREYVFYTSHTDIRHRQRLIQQGTVVTCTYDEARERCVELNRDRKRGQRMTMLPLDAFEKHLRQRHDE